MPHFIEYGSSIYPKVLTKRYKNGVFFSKSNDHGTIAAHAELVIDDSTVNAFFFSVVFNSLSAVNSNGIFGNITNSISTALYVSNQGQMLFEVFNNTSRPSNIRSIRTATNFIKPGHFYNILIQKNGNNSANWNGYINRNILFPNKSNLGTMTAGTTYNTHYVGTFFNTSTGSLTTDQGDVTVFKSARFKRLLTADEIDFISKYDGLLPNTISLDTDVHYYHDFREKSGNTVADISPNGRNITLVNCTTALGATNQWVNKKQEAILA